MDYQLALSHFTLDQKPLFGELTLPFPVGKTSVILGPSGIGKSVVLKIIAKLIPNSPVLIDSLGQEVHHRMAYMAQQDLLMPWLSVLENTMIGYRLRGELNESLVQKARDLLARVGLSNEMHLRPSVLSGGMRQRVALVRTLMEDTPIVLMDEPFSALDVATRHQAQNLTAELFKGKTVILVTHEPREAIRLGHRIHVLGGRPAQRVESLELHDSPARDESTPENLHLQERLIQ
ncbi:MAG: ABC transporter ATP-binding protein, partial [Gammaproteobacteria bacterium]|nr:ABC transporter ATP-binding protein [Gammaproteobacteria bacterium]